jgi:hypothetical protein
MIDLRKEFDEILEEYGHDVLLQRTDRRVHCKCWNRGTSEADPECLICNGTGWVTRIERIRVRREDASQVITRPNRAQGSPLGKVWASSAVYYMRYSVVPQVGDFIYEVRWRHNQPVKILSAYEINDINALRGDRGRVEYYAGYARLDSTNLRHQNLQIRKIGPIVNYEWRH